MNSTPRDAKLTFDECWELLGTAVIGRLAMVVDGHPEIFPVNFVVERRGVVFRTAGGTKLWQAQKDQLAAFEIDGYDVRTEEAWSVVARGSIHLVASREEQSAADGLGLEPWEPGPKSHYVRLTPNVLTGRRFRVSAPDVWTTRLHDPRRASFQ